jgi:hypothetical protein
VAKSAVNHPSEPRGNKSKALFAIQDVDQRAIVMVALGVVIQASFSFAAATWFGRLSREVETSEKAMAASGSAKL